MNTLINELKEKVVGKNIRIVFPEGNDARIVATAARLHAEKSIIPVLLGNKDVIAATAREAGVALGDIETHDPENDPLFDELVAAFVERRAGKATEEQARLTLRDPNYFGTMLVHIGNVDGLVSGAIHSTGDTVRPALQIIKTKPGIKKTSGAMVMIGRSARFIFADVAININPDSADLAETAITSAETAAIFNIDPKIAMLSFSTHGSAKSPDATAVADATQLVRDARPDLVIDGEIQFDAAFVPEVAELKAPDSPLAGNASVFVFPNLSAGNIGYKLVQRFAKLEAVGPILQGLNKPVNDLSRGCTADDAYKLALITAVQAVAE